MKYLNNTVKIPRFKPLLLVTLGMVYSQSFAGYEINKYSINSGGSTMKGSRFEMSSSIAQVDSSNTMTQENFSINGGYWHQNTDLIFKNGVE